MARRITYAKAIREALEQGMERDSSVFVIGEGVPDPKGAFGTTKSLIEKFGKKRVMEMPVSENAMTGVCIGAALSGLRPVMVHLRVDFTLLALDQIINNAAKWSYMFGGQSKVPLVIRMMIGRGWGQGPQHSQSLQALYAHIPGLKVVMPTSAYDAKGMLMAAMKENNPVIFIEHRWLYDIEGEVPEKPYEVPIGKGRKIREGKDITIAATSYMNVEALKAAECMEKEGISAEIIDIRCLKPFDEDIIIDSVKKTGRLLVLDTGHYTAGFSAEVVSRVSEKAFSSLKAAPRRIAMPDIPCPTTRGLTRYYYPLHSDVVRKVYEMLGRKEIPKFKEETVPLDLPDKSFRGPF